MSEDTVHDFSKSGSEINWEKFKLDLTQPVPAPEVMIYQSDSEIPMLHKRNISIIGAHAKVGKTFLVSAIASAALNEEGFLNMCASDEGMIVLLIDTEQDISDTQEVVKRVHHCNGWDLNKNNPRFVTINLREVVLKERANIIEAAIAEIKPDLVLLDGIVDLVSNFNDIEESQETVEMLTRWATQYDCHITTCLHINKGNLELRGHLGAFIKQKGELTLKLTKEDGLIKVIVEDSRHKPIEDFYFRINEKGLPEIYHIEPPTPTEEKLKILFNEILSSSPPMRHKHLTEKVMEEDDVRKDMAQKKIAKAKSLGIIVKNKTGAYQLPVLDPEQTEMFP